MTQHSAGGEAAFLPDWVHQAAEVPGRGLVVEREATAQELEVLAEALDVRSFSCLRATYELHPRAGGGYRLDGRIQARLVQACVVSLAPVETSLNEAIRADFDDDQTDASRDDWDSEDAIAVALNRDHEPIHNGLIDAGRVVFEQIAAVLDPYPRAPGATFQWTDPRQRHDEGGGGRPDNPFAVLRKLKGDG